MSRPAPSDEWVAAVVRDAVAAPSMHNAQPWCFRYLRQSRAFQVWPTSNEPSAGSHQHGSRPPGGLAPRRPGDGTHPDAGHPRGPRQLFVTQPLEWQDLRRPVREVVRAHP